MSIRFGLQQEPSTRAQEVEWAGETYKLEVYAEKPRRKLDGWIQDEIALLPSVVELIKTGLVEPFISHEVRMELANLKFGGLLQSDLGIYHEVEFKMAPDPFPYQRVIASGFDHLAGQDGLNQLYASNFDLDFVKLKKELGGNKDGDAFHILTAERAEIEFFLTMDRRLINSFRNQCKSKLNVSPVMPSELIKHVEESM